VTAHPALAPHASTVSAAVNATYAKLTVRVAPGDDVAFLPPVSGG
jgi:molybdopterin converting factor small subunit